MLSELPVIARFDPHTNCEHNSGVSWWMFAIGSCEMTHYYNHYIMDTIINNYYDLCLFSFSTSMFDVISAREVNGIGARKEYK